MQAFLRLKNIHIENANAIAGITYGFPAVTHFLGFSHALSRKFQEKYGLSLDKCAIIVHQYHLHAYKKNAISDSVFCLTRNPLTKEQKPSPFNEEGKMHLTLTLLIECVFTQEDLGVFGKETIDENETVLQDFVRNFCFTHSLAGGLITEIEDINLIEFPVSFEKKVEFRKRMRELLPGYLLTDRTDLLQKNLARMKKENPRTNVMDAWLDFMSIKYKAHENDKDTSERDTEWQRLEKTFEGWLVPLNIGYRGISPIYPAGKVKKTRDSTTPFRFVESVYTIGQWRSLYRVESEDLKNIFWRYHVDPESGWYLCKNDLSSKEDNYYFN